MELMNFLKNSSFNLELLTKELGISVKEYDELYVLNYNQIESPKTHPVVMECRGIILDKALNVVCRPFDRFFNMGEAPDTQKQLDMTKAVAFEKVDGSLIKIYYYKQWEIATRGTAFAESNVGGFDLTFRQLVLKSLALTEEEFQITAERYLDKAFTYCFEVTSVENRVVTPYSGYSLHYLGARETSTGAYASEKAKLEALTLGAKYLKRYKFNSPLSIKEAANALSGLQEGFVVWQEVVGQFKPLCKVKAEAYLAVHSIKGEGLTPRRIAELVLTGEEEEYLAYFNDDRVHFQPYVEAYEILKQTVEAAWCEVKSIEDQKQFALAVKSLPFASVMFLAKKTKEDAVHCFNEARLSYRVEVLKGYLK